MSRIADRQRLMRTLAQTWEKYPSLRFGQLVSNITPDGIDLFYVDDESFELAIWRWVEQFPEDKESTGGMS